MTEATSSTAVHVGDDVSGSKRQTATGPIFMDQCHALVAYDIETTGGPNGTVFSIGFAWSVSHDWGVVHRHLIARNVFFPYGVNADDSKSFNFEQSWKRQKFDQQTWTEFWSKNVHVLKKQVEYAETLTDQEFATRINDYIAMLENLYASITFVTDTINFDPVFVNKLLTRAGFEDLSHTRDGKYVSGRALHLGSFLMGVDRAQPWTPRDQGQPMRDASREYGNSMSAHTHIPDDDAANILHRTLFAMKLVERSNQCMSLL